MTTDKTIEEMAGAVFSDCRKYRYQLWRIWDKGKPLIAFIGLNPSTANEIKNDPTIRRVIEMAKTKGFGGVYMLNLFGYVTPYPEELLKCPDPVGENDFYLRAIIPKISEVVFCWGNFKEAKERAKVASMIFPDAKALVINKDGSPRHPLYVKKRTELISYTTTKQRD